MEDGEKAILLPWLSEETLLLQKPTQRQGEFMRQELTSHGIHPKKVMDHSNIRAAFALAAGGYEVAFISGSLLVHLSKTCTVDAYRLADVSTPFPFVAAYRKGGYIPDYAAEFIRLVKEDSNRLGG